MMWADVADVTLLHWMWDQGHGLGSKRMGQPWLN